ncbi:MAG: hypothetical protein O6948_11575, partial [Deltaproteobacteria bacterium]|nr:hypothetical protein [Deltaproteobacteria bacterium]
MPLVKYYLMTIRLRQRPAFAVKQQLPSHYWDHGFFLPHLLCWIGFNHTANRFSNYFSVSHLDMASDNGSYRDAFHFPTM